MLRLSEFLLSYAGFIFYLKLLISLDNFLLFFEWPGVDYIYWDSKASSEDMLEMWNHPDVAREWIKSRERRGKVRFSHDKDKRPYLSQVEVKV